MVSESPGLNFIVLTFTFAIGHVCLQEREDRGKVRDHPRDDGDAEIPAPGSRFGCGRARTPNVTSRLPGPRIEPHIRYVGSSTLASVPPAGPDAGVCAILSLF